MITLTSIDFVQYRECPPFCRRSLSISIAPKLQASNEYMIISKWDVAISTYIKLKNHFNKYHQDLDYQVND